MHPIEMDVFVAMRHEELRRLRKRRRGDSTVPDTVEVVSVAHRVCGRFLPVVQQGELRCA
jgi:hypothetical protein